MAKKVTQFDFTISSSQRRGRGEDQCCPSPVQNEIVSGAVKDAEHEMDSASQSLDDHVADRLECDDDGETEGVVNVCEKDCCIDCCKPDRESPNQPTLSTIPLKTKKLYGGEKSQQPWSVSTTSFAQYPWLTWCER